MTDDLNLNARYVCNPDVVLREEDEDGGLIFNPDTNQVKIVNPTGLFIWKQFNTPNGFEGVVQAVIDSFEDVPLDEVRKDVEEFLSGMVLNGFIGEELS
jgi:hypothetical protein